MSVGNYWYFENEFGQTYVQDVFGTKAINGDIAFRFSNWAVGNYLDFVRDGCAIKAVAFNDGELTPPCLFDCGDSFVYGQSRFSFACNPDPVTTPAGTFSDVITLTEEIDDGDGYVRTGVQYFARNIGQIKHVDYYSADGSGSYLSTYLLKAYGEQDSAMCLADLNWDGSVDGLDLAIFADNYGRTDCIPWHCQDDDVDGGIFRICNYWPLEAGNQWLYTTGNYFILNQTGICTSGYSGIRLGTTTYEFEPFIQNKDLGLFFTGCQYDEGVWKYIGFPFSLIPPEMTPGSVHFIDGQDWTFQTTLVGLETVTVPAGTFNDTLKISIAITHKDGSCSYNTTLWLAKGIGPVKILRSDAEPADCLGCIFVCDPNNDLVKLNTPAELISAIVNGNVY